MIKEDTLSKSDANEIRSSGYRPLSLEQLGVEKDDFEIFCQEAEAWLGLIIDQTDVRKSTRDGRFSDKPRLSRQNLDDYIEKEPYLAKSNESKRYSLMARLFHAVAIQEFLNSGILDDPDFIQTANQIVSKPATDDETTQEIIDLFKTLKSFFDSYRQKIRNIQAGVPEIVVKLDDEQTKSDDMRVPSDFSSKLANNIGHDLMHIIPVRFLEQISYSKLKTKCQI